MSVTEDSGPIRLVSELTEGRDRFLSRALDQVLQDGWRSPDDFLRHFPPTAIMESLAEADDLRVTLLVETTGTNQRIALKKSISSATEDLELALEEGITSAKELVELFPPDDKVRYLDHKKLWELITEDEFWTQKAADDKPAHTKAAQRLTFMIECALEDDLLTLKDVADGITFQEISTCLPVMELQEVVKHALQIARADAPLTEERLLAVVPLPSIIEFVLLEHTWSRVVVERIAAPAGYVEAAAPASNRPLADARVKSAPPPTPPDAKGSGSVPPPPPAGKKKRRKSDSKPTNTDRPPEEDDARRRVVQRLSAIDRLPKSYEKLASPILLSIESMYADLSSISEEEERESCVREAFPNESHLRNAMLALIELLDPSVNTKDPVIRDADVEGLIKIVLFEERRRQEPRKSKPPASAARRGRSVPPPLPKSSAPPPPLPSEAAARKG